MQTCAVLILVLLLSAGCDEPMGPARLGDWTEVQTGLDATLLDAAYVNGVWAKNDRIDRRSPIYSDWPDSAPRRASAVFDRFDTRAPVRSK